GRQFLFVALFMMSIGGLMAMLMRLDLAWPDTQFSFLSILPQSLQNDSAISQHLQRRIHDARHDHDLLRGDADPGWMFRQLPDSADDRRTRHGVSQTQYAVVLGERGRRRDHDGIVLG